jgi:excisionase family DNA binding protein
VDQASQRQGPSLLMTVQEASMSLRISRAQLYILANKQHVIELVHIGRLARVPRASLEAYVASLSANAGRESEPDAA